MRPEHRMRSSWCLVLIATLLGSTALAPGPASASSGAHASSAEHLGVAAASDRADEPAELTVFLDEVVAEQMRAHDIPGGVVVIVEGGEVVVSRGYGFADRERQVAVDPVRTRFDIGSVTKLFTATAVMQQVELGAIDLEEDVNRYLSRVQVPATYPQPVTTAHLLTHTAGFAERMFVGWFTTNLDDIEPLGDNLAIHLPPRVRPPGEAHQYNNHGMGLAGHAVETVSGQSFDTYVTDNILAPLGMHRSTFGRPPAVEANDAVGYDSTAGPTMPIEPWYLHLRPAGGLWTTGDDMAAFMLAHLQGGAVGDRRILAADTVEAMHGTQFRGHPSVAGIGYGFFEGPDLERGAVQHGGGWAGFGSMLSLLPDDGLGVFVAFNHSRGPYAASAVVRAVVDHLVPLPPAADAPAVSTGDLRAFEGTYRWNRHDRHTFMRLISTLQAPMIRVVVEQDGTLTTVGSPELPPETRWGPTDEPGVFTAIDGRNTLAFDVSEGRAARLHVAGAQLFPMNRVAWYASNALHAGLLVAMLAAMTVAVTALPVGNVRRRLRPRQSTGHARLRTARRVGAFVGALGLVFVVGLVASFVADPAGMLEPGTFTKALLWLPLIAIPLTVWLAVAVVRLWTDRAGSPAGRIYHTVIAVMLVGLLPFLYHWRLLGFHY